MLRTTALEHHSSVLDAAEHSEDGQRRVVYAACPQCSVVNATNNTWVVNAACSSVVDAAKTALGYQCSIVDAACKRAA